MIISHYDLMWFTNFANCNQVVNAMSPGRPGSSWLTAWQMVGLLFATPTTRDRAPESPESSPPATCAGIGANCHNKMGFRTTTTRWNNAAGMEMGLRLRLRLGLGLSWVWRPTACLCQAIIIRQSLTMSVP